MGDLANERPISKVNSGSSCNHFERQSSRLPPPFDCGINQSHSQVLRVLDSSPSRHWAYKDLKRHKSPGVGTHSLSNSNLKQLTSRHNWRGIAFSTKGVIAIWLLIGGTERYPLVSPACANAVLFIIADVNNHRYPLRRPCLS